MVISKLKCDISDELRCKPIKVYYHKIFWNVIENFVARVVLVKETIIILRGVWFYRTKLLKLVTMYILIIKKIKIRGGHCPP